MIRRLEDVKQVGPRNGQVTFKGYRLSHVAAALHSCLYFDVEIPEREERYVIVEAIRSVGEVGKLTAPKVLRAITEGEACFSARSEEPYVLVTSVSARHFEGMGAEELGGAAFAFDRFVPEPFGSQHEEARRNSEHRVVGKLPKRGTTMRSYAGVRVSVLGRSQEEAKERALDALDLLRGMWNLGINRNIGDRTSIGVRTSNNKVSLGPVHSLHYSDGQFAETPWLETDYVKPMISYRMNRDWRYVKEYEEWVREELRRIPYRRDLEAVIRAYARALDRRDWDTSFVRLWAVLETLTDTGRTRYEMTEKRTLFLIKVIEEKDTPYHRQILRHLTRYRNRTVHAGHETLAIQTLLFQLKFYVEQLLEFHLSADPAFGNFEEAARFLDPPTDLAALRERTRRR